MTIKQESVAVAVMLFLALLFIWILPAKCEADAYNRLTGGNATWWDALWVELRVMQ